MLCQTRASFGPRHALLPSRAPADPVRAQAHPCVAPRAGLPAGAPGHMEQLCFPHPSCSPLEITTLNGVSGWKELPPAALTACVSGSSSSPACSVPPGDLLGGWGPAPHPGTPGRARGCYMAAAATACMRGAGAGRGQGLGSTSPGAYKKPSVTLLIASGCHTPPPPGK